MRARTSNGRVNEHPLLSLTPRHFPSSPRTLEGCCTSRSILRLAELPTSCVTTARSRALIADSSPVKGISKQRCIPFIDVGDSGSREATCDTAPTPKLTPTFAPLSAQSSRRYGAGATGVLARSPRSDQRSDGCTRTPRHRGGVESGTRKIAKLWNQLRESDRREVAQHLDLHQNVWYIPTLDKLEARVDSTRSSCVQKSGGGHDRCISFKSGEHVAFRFEMLSVLGAGNFGQVCRCFDHKHKREVALKVINADESFKEQAKVEIMALRRASNGSSRVVKMLEHFTFRRHTCVVFELLDANLYEFLAARNFRRLEMRHIRHISSQMIEALVYLKEVHVVHCDIKPENILLARAGCFDVKLIDFGSACFRGNTVYSYIQSRYYRAPEVMLGLPYSHPIDMWSFACVVAELATGCTLFAGEDEAQQLNTISALIGPPPKRLLECATIADRRVDCSVSVTSLQPVGDSSAIAAGRRSRPRRRDHPVVDIDDDVFNAFLKRALCWTPSRRLAPEAAARHRFLSAPAETPSITARPSALPETRVRAIADGS